MSAIGQLHVHSQCVHMLVSCHFFSFFKCYAKQKRRAKHFDFLFPGRLILFFQIRALTGFWYCILMWFRSGLSFFFLLAGIRRNGLLTDVAHMGGAKQLGAVATKQDWTNTVDSGPEGPPGNVWIWPVSDLWALRTFFSFFKSC